MQHWRLREGVARHGRLCCRLCGPAISFPLLCHTMPAMACVVPSDTHAPMTLACPMQATHHFPRAAAMRSATVATSLATGQVSGVYIGCRSAVVYCPCHAMPCHLMMCRVPAIAWSTVPCLAMPGHFHNGSVHVIVQHLCRATLCHAMPRPPPASHASRHHLQASWAMGVPSAWARR